MTIQPSLRVLAGLAIVALATLVAVRPTPADGSARPAPGAPNIVIVTIDTLRADRLSAYGYERNTTPNLDKLIGAGVRFDHSRTVEPLTNPALCSMVTSLYPHQHGGSRNGLRLRDGLNSLPRELESRGYRTTAFVGNWTLRDKLSGLAEHFTEYEDVLTRARWFGMVRREATADDITESSLTWIEEHQRRNRGEPFLLWAHYVEPHAPYRLQEDHLEQLGLQKGKLTDADRYDTEIAYVDRSVGDLLAGIEKIAPGQPTLIVFTSDHGESLGEHKYWGHGRNLHEPGLQVPLSITWTGHIEPGSVIDTPSLIIDIAPTVLGLLEHDVPESFEGFDWSGVLFGGDPPTDRVTRFQAHKGAVISGHDSELSRTAGLLEVGIVQGLRKEIFRIGNEKRQLFDLAQDAAELENLSSPTAPPTEGLSEWMAIVIAGLGTADNVLPEPLDDESIEELRSLGYVD